MPQKTALRFFLPALFTVLGLMSTSFQTRAQSTIAEINADLRQLLVGLDTPTMGQSRDFLFDMACHTTDSTLWDGPIGADTINADVFFSAYEEMRNMAYDTSIMIHKDTVFYHALELPKDTIMMHILAYDYYTFIDTALTTNTYFDFDTVNTKLTDKYPRPGYPFNINKMFMAAPTIRELPFRTVTYRVDRSNFFHDEWNDLPVSDVNLKIDFGDGSGYHNFGHLPSPQHVTVTYPAGGDFIITTVVEDAGANVLALRKSAVEVPVAEDAPAPDSTWNTHDLNISAWFPCDDAGAQPLEKTIIYVEGIDPTDYMKSLNRTGNQIYRDQIRATNIADLRNFGYTFLVVDWENSRRDMKDNAANIENLLADLKCHLESIHSDQQFVVIGESMGGVVCTYALAEMEQKANTKCYPNEMHNTRLFITVDAPHQGANIPLSIQHQYKDIVSGIGPLGMGMPQMLSTSLGQLSSVIFNAFLDAKAAKQLLIYHADTRDPYMMYSHYDSHPARQDWLDDLEDVGGHPQYCKTFAYSNGSLSGMGQTRYYDREQRIPNDKLLDLNHDAYIRVFGVKVKLAGLTVDLRTNPDGQGMLSRVEAGTWTVRVRLRWFGVRVRVSPSSLASLERYADVLPYCTAPGGVFDGTSNVPETVSNIVGAVFCWGAKPVYNGSGTWTMGRYLGGHKFGLGVGSTLYSDGFYWNFVPTYSALDYQRSSLYDDIENESVSTKMSKTPFDVIMGIHEEYLLLRGREEWTSRRYNRWHTTWRNDFLRKDDGVFGDVKRYDVCSGARLSKRAFNREIGDDSLLLENRVLPWTATHDAYQYIGVDQRSSYYEYDGFSTSERLQGVYSRDSKYSIQSPGYVHFFTRDVGQPGHFEQGSLSSSEYDTASLGHDCCSRNYNLRQAKPGADRPDRTVLQRLTVYPNPTTGNSDINVRFPAQGEQQSSVSLYDALGREVFGQKFAVPSGVAEHTETLHLPVSLSTGSYLLILRNGSSVSRQQVSIITR